MSDTFTRDRDGKKFRDFLHQEFGDSATGTEHYRIEPIPTPPQTEEDILREMDEAIFAAVHNMHINSAKQITIARAIVAACRKLHGRGK